MPGRGPAPKHPSLRQRRNKTSTRATLPSEAASQSADVPDLPERDGDAWHVRVTEWWADVWTSPMASEYLTADRHRLRAIAELWQIFWKKIDSGENPKEIATEIRLQEVSFGLTPMDRRRLQWEVERGESAATKTRSRGKRKKSAKDPRSVLKLA